MKEKSEQAANDRPWNRRLDGEVVIECVKDPNRSNLDGAFEFSVQKYLRPNPDPHDRLGMKPRADYFGVTPYRSIVWTGDSPEEVIAWMLAEVARLARRGAINPEIPHEKGVPPIQHCMSLLSERLAWQIEQRRVRLVEWPRDPSGEVPPQVTSSVARDNDVVAALATALAALARVKDL